MIISHKYKFIFIKTEKTAGTSIEVFLSKFCDDNDIVTPIYPHIEGHKARNYEGIWNPLRDIFMNRGWRIKSNFKQLRERRKFYNHMAARRVRARVPEEIWNSYYKFCVERNPWDKTLSHYYMCRQRAGENMSLDDYFKKGKFCSDFTFYTDIKDNLIVDRVVKYENLMAELGEVFDKLHIPFEGSLGVAAKSESRSDRTPYQEVFSKEQKSIIAQVFSKEISLLDYSF